MKSSRPLSTALAGLCLLLSPLASAAPAPPIPQDELESAAQEAYAYAYPLVLMEITRRVSTNVAEPNSAALHAPVNQFAHASIFPDHTFTDVVRANADTLYSMMWYDVSKEPLVISLPDSGGRFYLLPMLDMWTDTFATPGKRASGTQAQRYALTAPDWSGKLPEGTAQIVAPTPHGWILGRTQTNGKADYEAVHRFQAGIDARPLSSVGNASWTAPRGEVKADLNMDAPVRQVDTMPPAAFYSLFLDLLKIHPPHQNDQTVLMRLARLGLIPGEPFDFSALPAATRAALEAAPAQVRDSFPIRNVQLSRNVNNWSLSGEPIGTYGTDYYKRALIAYFGLGALPLESAFYPTSMVDAQGRPLYDSAKKYTMHFSKEQLPKVHAFWSVTMYNAQQFFAENPINRYAIGDRDALKYHDDGSLTLYIQRDNPGKEKESNWLPAPQSGTFNLTMRLYWPDTEMTSGNWQIPAVTEQK